LIGGHSWCTIEEKLMQSKMNNNNNAPSFNEFTADVKQWTLRNFGNKQNPFIGMVEELGELSRCIIKRMQGIRGYENAEFFAKCYIDAIGDIGVYSANFAYRFEISAEWPDVSKLWNITTHSEHIAHACRLLGNLGIHTSGGGALDAMVLQSWFTKFLHEIDSLAILENSTLMVATTSTWAQVKNRDWTKNKTDGLIKAEA
jgi:hypothetical protein